MKTINENEAAKFAKLADQWWNQDGKFKPLHMINPVRVQYIFDYISRNIKASSSNLTLLDVGCGGGLLSESMARMGLNVIGIDIVKENIEVAKIHAKKSNLIIDYQVASVEELVNRKDKYDIITVMEVVEHVDNLQYFFECVCNLLNDGGIIFISTLNRTIKSFLFAIIGAEYVLRWLPIGTHSWNKFIKPSEIAELLYSNNVTLKELRGINYSIMNNEWNIGQNISVNYIAAATKIDLQYDV